MTQLGAPGPNDLSSVVCSRRENDEMQRLRYRLNPSKHRLVGGTEEKERGGKRRGEEVT